MILISSPFQIKSPLFCSVRNIDSTELTKLKWFTDSEQPSPINPMCQVKMEIKTSPPILIETWKYFLLFFQKIPSFINCSRETIMNLGAYCSELNQLKVVSSLVLGDVIPNTENTNAVYASEYSDSDA